ncbi:MAG: mannose-1-phosphate guanylyltransferase [bacterium]
MFALIMAGGLGTRFWPKSRKGHPKQVLEIIGEKSLLQNTVERSEKIIPTDKIFVVSTREQVAQIKKHIGAVPDANIITEPKRKNTAPCIGLAALFMERLDPEAVMVVCPADHLISNYEVFNETLRVGEKVASETNGLVLIGIEPHYPATGYGYIQFRQNLQHIGDISLLKVKAFAEKPNRETAERFLRSGDFLWNSGIFIWKIQTILREIEEHVPQLYDGLMEIRAAIGTPRQEETINRVYCQIRSISIDYGVMEKAKEVMVLKGNFGWNDLGSWDEVYKLREKDKNENALIGEHIIKDSTGCYIDAPEKCIAVIGMENLVVVDTRDALLICPRDRVQEVKDIVEIAKRKKMERFS